MKQFIQTNDGDLINLCSVSNVVFVPDWKDRFGNHKPKIIYNFDYTVSLPRSEKKVVDYKYSIFESLNKYEQEAKQLNKAINELGWLAPIINNKIDKIINPNKISFITKDDDNLRIIINLNAPVSFHMDYSRLTSDFIYLNCTDWDEYQNNLRQIMGILSMKEITQ